MIETGARGDAERVIDGLTRLFAQISTIQAQDHVETAALGMAQSAINVAVQALRFVE